MGTATGMLQMQTVFSKHVPGRAAATATVQWTIGSSPYTGAVSAVKYFADAAVTGANTDSTTLTLYNRKADGSGTTAIATLALVSGVNLVQYVGKVITLSGTAANLDVAAGDVLEWESAKVGNGLTDPGGVVEFIVTRD